jgi:hypothetical protein
MGDPFYKERPSRLVKPGHSEVLNRRADQLEAEFSRVRWADFETAYGAADWVPLDLRFLMLGAHDQAMGSAHRLWCGLCHQHAYVSSAAEPALPWIIEALHSSDARLQVEILDILLGILVCHDPNNPFLVRLFRRVADEAGFIASLTASPHEELASFAAEISAALRDQVEEQAAIQES